MSEEVQNKEVVSDKKEQMKKIAKIVGKWGSVWIWGWFWIIHQMYLGFFCVHKNGASKKSFSSKKFFAFVLLSLAIANHLHLHLYAVSHWTTTLSKNKVHYSVIITLIGSLDALAAWALSVYYKAKRDNAA